MESEIPVKERETDRNVKSQGRMGVHLKWLMLSPEGYNVPRGREFSGGVK